MLLGTLNFRLPAEVWSPTGQRWHHLIGLLPAALQAFLLLMSFKAERHLPWMPTLRAALIHTAQRKRNENSPGESHCVTSAHCHIPSRKNWLIYFLCDCWGAKVQIAFGSEREISQQETNKYRAKKNEIQEKKSDDTLQIFVLSLGIWFCSLWI